MEELQCSRDIKQATILYIHARWEHWQHYRKQYDLETDDDNHNNDDDDDDDNLCVQRRTRLKMQRNQELRKSQDFYLDYYIDSYAVCKIKLVRYSNLT